MAYLNKIMVIGNVGGDPEMRFTPNGKPVTNFNLATNRFFKKPDGEQAKETEWFTVVTWERQAESCNNFLTKGQRVYVEGRVRTRSWDGTDGQKHFRVEIHASRVIFLERTPGGSPNDEAIEEVAEVIDSSEGLPGLE